MAGVMAIWLLAALTIASVAADPSADPGAPFVFIPPVWSSRVVFYHSFESGVREPEINVIQASIEGVDEPLTDGFTRTGYPVLSGKDARKPLRITSPALSPHRPLTIMFWWRLDQEMAEDLTFCLFYAVSPGRPGYIANAVHGKSNWCALREPSLISQVHGYARIMNHHNQWGGRVWPQMGEWRHWAMTATGADTLSIYWDGNLRETIAIKGRPFQENDIIVAGFGEQYSRDGKPDAALTFDELLVLDRALRPDEIQAYVLAASRLRERQELSGR
ncbi:MAG: hypothetical protein QM473_15380 [Acidobacteriota bacterium]|nr:hypothetical protein [Acidobacteriota bacterium]